ncbi:glycosyltransferase [Flavobacterium psychrophilum]|uniref:glycosyltransferase n=1 Tax=Flavobacterium psychrophilum TaxID=96345 RepID=UPI00106DCB51|nr:glycosyltransferase [Flavobacterium psychrophilum]
MSQKICIISFDHWNYDKHIVDKLNEKGIDSFHIKIGGFKHKHIGTRIINTFSKIVLGKNPKIKKRQEHIIKMLEEKGFQDQILVINPEVISLEYHQKIKKFTPKYIAYLYDSVERCPIEHLLHGVFNEIYSFDKGDVKEYGFKETTNYNYLEKQPITDGLSIKNQVLYIASFDNRLEKVMLLKQAFEKIKVSYKFIIVGKKTSLYKLKNVFSSKILGIEFKRNRIKQNDLKKLYAQTQTILDLVRDNQSGLSFRVFEAMAFQKKLITNNKNIKTYNFYNPNNILVLENENYDFDKCFFETNYEPLSDKIYYQYSLDNWVNTIFKI